LFFINSHCAFVRSGKSKIKGGKCIEDVTFIEVDGEF
jgi:hypothetical protein